MSGLFGWCAGPEGSIPDHDACPERIGGPDGLACTCGCHDDGEADE